MNKNDIQNLADDFSRSFRSIGNNQDGINALEEAITRIDERLFKSGIILDRGDFRVQCGRER